MIDWNEVIDALATVGTKIVAFLFTAWLASVAFNELTEDVVRMEWYDAVLVGFLLRWVAVRLRIGA